MIINPPDNEKFFENEVYQLNIGELLKNYRQKHQYEIKEIASYLCVKEEDLLMLENNNIDKITKNIYIPGLIKTYGKFLQISNVLIEEKLLDINIRSNTEIKKHTLLNIGENNELAPTKNMVIRSSLIFMFIFLTSLIIFFYSKNNQNIINTKNILLEINSD